MQTRFPAHQALRRPLKRAVTALMVACAICSLSACTAPYLAKDESNSAVDACENATGAARREIKASQPGFPLLRRYLALQAASDSWNDVAADCPTGFAEGTMQNAQARFRRTRMGRMLGMTSPTPAQTLATSQTLSTLTAMHDTAIATSLSAMAKAEDQAGFAVQVLAARHAPHASLALSDNHKAVASSLVSLGRVNPDPRTKVYPVETLIAQPAKTTDTATGLTEPTMAVIEMDCARTSATALTDSSKAASHAEIRALSALVSSRAYLAFALGYPSYDEAVYK